jgi:hypothetical protein
MRKDKAVAFQLRREGKSYRDIQNELGISRSTLCDWFRNEEWSKHIKYKNNNINIGTSTDRINKMNLVRGLMLEGKYKKVIEEAQNEYLLYRNNPLFTAGLMLYAGEGDHLSKGAIKFTNIDFGLHKIFINFCNRFLKTDMNSIKFSVLLYPDLDIDNCMDKWSTELGIPKQNMYKPQVIIGKFKKRKLHFGVGTSIILNSFLKHKLLFWIDQTKFDLSK